MRVSGQLPIVVSLLASGVWLGAQVPSQPAGTQQSPESPPRAQAPASAAAQAPQNPEMAAKILADVRKALGGDAKLSAVKTFVAAGRTRRVSGDNLVPVEFEINVEFPDKYVRKDEIPAQETAPSSSGFNGDGLIQIPPPAAPAAAPAQNPPGRAASGGPGDARSGAPPAAAPPGAAGAPAGRPGGPPAMTPEQQQEAARRSRVNTIKQDFARLTLGMFASSFSSYPLTFGYVGQAEAPQGKADVLEVKGAGNFTARLFVASDTHLPIMVSWTTPVTPANIVLTQPGQARPTNLQPGAIVVEGPAAPPSTASTEDKDKYAKDVAALRQKTVQGAKPIENRLYYADYRDSDGLQFPFRLRRAIGADTIEETIFDRFRLNARIDTKKFEVVK
jgi:hypothetical protein